MHINVNIIVTRKYHIFVQPLIDSICKYFLLRHKITINLFTDDASKEYTGDERVEVVRFLIYSFGFPEATLFRYEIMTSIDYDCDYIYYLDVDYLIVSEIDEEILGTRVAVLHPGFSVVGGGAWCNDEKSQAYTPIDKRKQYFAGGTQGGHNPEYLTTMRVLAARISHDHSKGIKAEWNDESHLNCYYAQWPPTKVLDSRYCMVQQQHLRELWKINHLEPKIIALKKSHAEFQQP